MTLTVRERIAEPGIRARRARAGAAFSTSCWATMGPLVVFVHGIGGVGKSTLLEAFTAEAARRRRDRSSPRLRRRSSRRRAASSTRSRRLRGASWRPPRTRRERLASLGPRVVLALDRYEVLRPLDLWLQQTFVPVLHDSVRVVLAGREGTHGRLVGDDGPRCSAACPWATCRATTPKRCCGGTASRATTSSASTDSPTATRCRCAWPPRRSSQVRRSTTTRRRSRQSSRSSPSSISNGSTRRHARRSTPRPSSVGRRSR